MKKADVVFLVLPDLKCRSDVQSSNKFRMLVGSISF